MVVEDDDLMREYIVGVLESVEFTDVNLAHDGIAAWRRFEQGDQFDLVICDWIMPGMDGLEVLKNIRDGRSAIPFILVTVRDTEEAVKRATDSGVTAFLAKPFKPDQLIAEVFRIWRTVPSSNTVRMPKSGNFDGPSARVSGTG